MLQNTSVGMWIVRLLWTYHNIIGEPSYSLKSGVDPGNPSIREVLYFKWGITNTKQHCLSLQYSNTTCEHEGNEGVSSSKVPVDVDWEELSKWLKF